MGMSDYYEAPITPMMPGRRKGFVFTLKIQPKRAPYRKGIYSERDGVAP